MQIKCADCKNFDYIYYECNKTRDKKGRHDGCSKGEITEEAFEFFKRKNVELSVKVFDLNKECEDLKKRIKKSESDITSLKAGNNVLIESLMDAVAQGCSGKEGTDGRMWLSHNFISTWESAFETLIFAGVALCDMDHLDISLDWEALEERMKKFPDQTAELKKQLAIAERAFRNMIGPILDDPRSRKSGILKTTNKYMEDAFKRAAAEIEAERKRVDE